MVSKTIGLDSLKNNPLLYKDTKNKFRPNDRLYEKIINDLNKSVFRHLFHEYWKEGNIIPIYDDTNKLENVKYAIKIISIAPVKLRDVDESELIKEGYKSLDDFIDDWNYLVSKASIHTVNNKSQYYYKKKNNPWINRIEYERLEVV